MGEFIPLECVYGSGGMFEETFPGVVGFLVANIKSGAEWEIKTPLLRREEEKSWPSII